MANKIFFLFLLGLPLVTLPLEEPQTPDINKETSELLEEVDKEENTTLDNQEAAHPQEVFKKTQNNLTNPNIRRTNKLRR